MARITSALPDPMKLLIHGTVHTLDGFNPNATGLLIDRGRIIHAGDAETLVEAFGGKAEIEDLDGATVLPGLTDAHIHLQHYALSLQKVECETPTLAECLRRVAERAQNTSPGEWVLGHGWQQNDWPDCTAGIGGFPTAGMLDAIAPEHPVYLTAKSLHAGWANSAALKIAGMSGRTTDPPDGALQRDPAGDPTGILLEGAMGLVARALPAETSASIRGAIHRAQRKLWEYGLTGVHDFDRRACFVALQELHAVGELQLRVVKTIPVEDLDHAAGLGLRGGFGDGMLWLGGVKAFADGALGPHTAAMLQPYQDDPDNRGMLLLDREQIFDYGRRSAEAGFAMTIHAIGDSANHEVLEAYRVLRGYEAEHGHPSRRHRIEHVQLLHPDDFDSLAELDVIASMQPIHAVSDMRAADQYWGSRSEFAYAWRSLLKLGTRMAFGSDAPVESPNPFIGLHAAVTRRRADGDPGPAGWYPGQRLSLMEALEGFTTGAAYAGRAEKRLGKLKAGFEADLIVLEKDIFSVEPEAIRELKPVRTMVAGRWVF